MATFVEDTVALLDALGIERAHVYGQSFGGMVGQELALTRPERVRTLILGCTHAGPRHAIRKDSKVPKGEPWRAMYAPGFPDRHPDHVADDLRIGAAQPTHPEGGRRQWEAMQGFDSFDRLPTLRVPTLILHGTEDQAIPVENAKLLAERIPGAELVLLEGAGHLYHSEQGQWRTPPCWTSCGGAPMAEVPDEIVRLAEERAERAPRRTSPVPTRCEIGSPNEAGPSSTTPTATTSSRPTSRHRSSGCGQATSHRSWATTPTSTRPSTGCARGGTPTSSARSRRSAPTRAGAPSSTWSPT